MYKEASKLKLRFTTPMGLLSVEQLWEVGIATLDILALSLETEYKESGKKSFLTKRTKKDKIAKLKFNIVLDILTTKMEEMELLTEAKEAKEHNSKILGLIAEKQDESLKGKSIKELENMLK